MNTIIWLPDDREGHGSGNLLRCMELARVIGPTVRHTFVYERPAGRNILEQYSHSCINSREAAQALAQANLAVFDFQGPLDASDRFAAWRHSNPALAIAALDYYGSEAAPPDLTFNLVPAAQPLHGAANHTGLAYAILRKEFLALRAPVRVPTRVEQVLVSFGGEDPQGLTCRVLQGLARRLDRPLRVKTVVGPFNTRLGDIQREASYSSPLEIEVLRYPVDIPRLIADSDFGFCGGGTSIMEFAFLGTPVMALPQHPMEAAFLDLFRGIDFLPQVSGCDAILDLALEEFHTPEARRKRAEIGQRNIDGQGASRIAGLLLAAMGAKQ